MAAKMHQYAPERRCKTSHSKPRNFFTRCRNTHFVWIMGSYHHHIITSPYHIIAIGITGAHPDNTPRKEGGL